MEQTVVIIKPDVFVIEQRDEYSQLKKELPGSDIFIKYVINKISQLDLSVTKQKKEKLSQEIVEEHYKEHKNNPEKFNSILWNMTFWPCYLMCIEWINAQQLIRDLIREIREEFLATPKVARRNMIHASANISEAQDEVKLHFN